VSFQNITGGGSCGVLVCALASPRGAVKLACRASGNIA